MAAEERTGETDDDVTDAGDAPGDGDAVDDAASPEDGGPSPEDAPAAKKSVPPGAAKTVPPAKSAAPPPAKSAAPPPAKSAAPPAAKKKTVPPAAKKKAAVAKKQDGAAASRRYTAPVPTARRGPSPRWVPVLMFAFWGIGLLLIILNYMGVLPGSEDGGNGWYLVAGLGSILAGIITATQYR